MMLRTRRTLSGMTLAIVLATAGCAGPASPPLPTPTSTAAAPTSPATAAPESSATPSPGATPTQPTPTPAPTRPAPTNVPTLEPSLPPFACGKAVSRPGSVPLALMQGLDASNDGGRASIVFSFRPTGNVAAVPDVTVRPVRPPFTRDPSGLPLEVAGAEFLEIVLQGGTALDANLEPTFAGPFDIPLDGSPIVEVKRAGDFEAVSTFIVGLDGPSCVRILPPDGSSRLVIEIRGV